MPRDANHFLDVADRQVVAPVRARQTAVDTHREKHAVHRDELCTAYWRWRREALLAGRRGDAAYRLIDFLEDMGLQDGAALMRLVQRGQWQSADLDTRLEILSLIDRAITGLGEKHGMPPFDNALPAEPPNVLLLIRKALA
jgi:hypothetical protein